MFSESPKACFGDEGFKNQKSGKALCQSHSRGLKLKSFYYTMLFSYW